MTLTTKVEAWQAPVSQKHAPSVPSARALFEGTTEGERRVVSGARNAASTRSPRCPLETTRSRKVASLRNQMSHLQRGCVLRDLTAFFVIVQGVEKDQIEVLERVERVFVLVLSERRLDTMETARLWYHLRKSDRLHGADMEQEGRRDAPRNTLAMKLCLPDRETCPRGAAWCACW